MIKASTRLGHGPHQPRCYGHLAASSNSAMVELVVAVSCLFNAANQTMTKVCVKYCYRMNGKSTVLAILLLLCAVTFVVGLVQFHLL